MGRGERIKNTTHSKTNDRSSASRGKGEKTGRDRRRSRGRRRRRRHWARVLPAAATVWLGAMGRSRFFFASSRARQAASLPSYSGVCRAPSLASQRTQQTELRMERKQDRRLQPAASQKWSKDLPRSRCSSDSARASARAARCLGAVLHQHITPHLNTSTCEVVDAPDIALVRTFAICVDASQGRADPGKRC